MRKEIIRIGNYTIVVFIQNDKGTIVTHNLKHFSKVKIMIEKYIWPTRIYSILIIIPSSVTNSKTRVWWCN